MTSTPLISICIPTFNRAALLQEALGTFLLQWQNDLTDEQRNQVELVISDNHSPDPTPEVITQFREANPTLRLTPVRQPENIGSSANILYLTTRATGVYIYLLSDDDLLLPGALAGILTLIQESPGLAAFCLNTRSFVQNPTKEITKPDFNVQSDKVISDCSDCLRFLGSRITFISLLMFRRDLICPGDYLAQKESLLLQSYPFLDVLAGGGMYVTRQVFLGVRGNNTGGYSFYEVFVSHFADVMRYARSQGYSEAAVRAVLSQHLVRFLAPFTAYFKLHGTFGQLQPDFRDGINRLFAEYGFHPLFIFGLLPMMLAPPKLAKGVHRISRWIKGQKEKRDAL